MTAEVHGGYALAGARCRQRARPRRGGRPAALAAGEGHVDRRAARGSGSTDRWPLGSGCSVRKRGDVGGHARVGRTARAPRRASGSGCWSGSGRAASPSAPSPAPRPPGRPPVGEQHGDQERRVLRAHLGHAPGRRSAATGRRRGSRPGPSGSALLLGGGRVAVALEHGVVVAGPQLGGHRGQHRALDVGVEGGVPPAAAASKRRAASARTAGSAPTVPEAAEQRGPAGSGIRSPSPGRPVPARARPPGARAQAPGWPPGRPGARRRRPPGRTAPGPRSPPTRCSGRRSSAPGSAAASATNCSSPARAGQHQGPGVGKQVAALEGVEGGQVGGQLGPGGPAS